jgi:hypothetical protein
MHETLNENGIRAIYFASNNNKIIKSTYFPHINIHKELGNPLMEELIIRLASRIMDVKVVDCDSDHQLDRIDIDRKFQSTKIYMVQGKGIMTLEN